jgi:tetracycline 7-halogenase / FADH2 O2-dependent halogenase
VTPDVDLAIVGSGFGGAILAMIARRLGYRVALLERGSHPRFAIGESASPLLGAVLEQLADRYDLPRLRPLGSYGAWRRAYPGVTCGLKRGFTYFHHQTDAPYTARSDRSNQLLVAASPSDEMSDTHWLRADVDHFLVLEAIALCADYVDRVHLTSIDILDDGCVLAGERAGQPFRIRSAAVVDASGPRGFLARALGIESRGFDGYPPTQALYSHFTGVALCAEMPEFATRELTPYPIDAAALHHVFDEGWMWVLRFDNGVTSAGIAVTDTFAQEMRLADGRAAWDRFLARYPTIAAQFSGATAIRDFTWMPRMAWRAGSATGPRWAMLPSATGFVDPLFSTGMPLTLLGIERLARALEAGTSLADADAYGAMTLREVDHTAGFVAGCYAGFPRFERFAAYSMFYFAAASFSEMARRLGRCSPGFLFAADAAFAGSMAELSPASTGSMSMDDYQLRIAEVLDRLNVAGLCDASKRNWYGIDLEDTVRAAAKLGVTGDAMRMMLAAFQ